MSKYITKNKDDLLKLIDENINYLLNNSYDENKVILIKYYIYKIIINYGKDDLLTLNPKLNILYHQNISNSRLQLLNDITG